MAYEVPGQRISLKLKAETAAYLGVSVTAANEVDVAASGAIVGVTQKPGKAGEAVPIIISGVVKGLLAGTVAAADAVEVTTGGKFIKKNTGTAVGVALEGGADKEIATILLY